MQKVKIYLFLTFIFFLFPFIFTLVAQESHTIHQNHSFPHYDRYIYNSDAEFHTAVKPYLNTQVEEFINIDSIYKITSNTKIADIIFNRNLIQYSDTDFRFTIDPLFNFEVGKDPDYDDISWINTRGFMVNAAIRKKISLSTSFYENQAVFNDYRHDRISFLGNRMVPGQGPGKAFGDSTATSYDYGFAEGYISYSPNDIFNFQLGHGKNFWGDGYRSLLLSDNTFNYPFFKITTDIWKIKYVNLWAQFQDIRQKDAYENAYAKKWGSFHFLDWQVTDWFSLGLFEAIIWQNGRRSSEKLL